MCGRSNRKREGSALTNAGAAEQWPLAEQALVETAKKQKPNPPSLQKRITRDPANESSPARGGLPGRLRIRPVNLFEGAYCLQCH